MRNLWHWLFTGTLATGLWALMAQPAQAQFFPLDGTMDEMNAEADRQISAARDAAAEAAAAEEWRKKNDERWAAITDFVEKRIRKIQSDANRGDTRKLVTELGNNRQFYRVGEIFFHLGAWSTAESQFKKSHRYEETAWPCNQGWTHLALVRCGLYSEFDGKEWNRLRRFEDTIKKAVEFLDRAVEEPNQRNRGAREKNFNDFKAELEQLPAAIQQRDALLAAVKENTMNAQAFVDLINHFMQRLHFTHQARAWVEALKEYCPESEQVVNGWADSQLAWMLTLQGFYEEADERMANAPRQAREQLNALRAKIRAIDEKIRSANESGQPINLTPEEKAIAGINVDKIEEQIDKNFERVRDGLNRHRQAIERDAGRRQGDG